LKHHTALTLDSALTSKIEASVAQTMKENQIPGLAIGIIKNKHVVYSKGFGVALIFALVQISNI
jgi:CubicO group peptidase (beta-lactamase class C family)